MKKTFVLSLLFLTPYCLTAQQVFPPSSGGGLTLATFASAPISPATNQMFLFTDASAAGTCTGGGTSYAICVWNGSSYAAPNGTSTGLGDPGANGPVYRNGAGTSIPGTASLLSGSFYCSDAGATDTYACNLSPAIASYITGSLYWFKANTANTGAASINFNAKGALTIKKTVGGITTDLNDNDIRVGQLVGVYYDGANAQMATPVANRTNAPLLSADIPNNAANTTGLAGTATALAANGTNCGAGQFPLGVDASGNAETCTALPTTIAGTPNQIAASAATGGITLSIPTSPTLPGTTTGTFSGNLTGTASLATAIASGSSGQIPFQSGAGVTAFDSGLAFNSGAKALGIIGAITSGQNGTAAGSYVLNGLTSGSTTLGVPSIAGTAHTILLPTAKGTSGQLLRTDGGTPEQTSWVTGSGGATIPSTTSTLAGDGAGNAVAVTGTGTNCVHVDGTSAACPGGGATIPSVTNVIKGNGSGNGADTKVAITSPATAATLAFGTDNATITFQGTDTYVGRATTDTLTNKSIAGAEINSGLVASTVGGTGVNNSATLTLGSANVNLATLGTGIVKNTTTTGVLTDAASSDVTGLFTGCSGTLYLGADGACHAPGTGTVTSMVNSTGVTWTNGTTTPSAAIDPAVAAQAEFQNASAVTCNITTTGATGACTLSPPFSAYTVSGNDMTMRICMDATWNGTAGSLAYNLNPGAGAQRLLLNGFDLPAGVLAGGSCYDVEHNPSMTVDGVATTAAWELKGLPSVLPAYIYVANAGVTGTLLNGLAKLTGAPSTAVRTATTDTGGAVGIVVAVAGTTLTAVIQATGPTSCVFDGATTAGHYVQISSTTAGNCHDSGATYPTSGQVIGRVLSTNGGAGTYTIDLFGSEIQAAAGAVSSVFSRTGAVTAQTGDYTATQVGLGSVTNDAQTKASIVPNTAPSAGQLLVGNAGGTAYAPISASGDFTLASTGAATVVQVNGAVVPTSAALVTTNASKQLVAAASPTTPITVGATGAIGCATCVVGTPSNHGVAIGTATQTVNFSTAGTSGQCLTSNGAAADPTFQTCGVGSGVTSLSGDGTLINNSLSTGAVTLTLSTAGAHKFWMNNTGSTAAPGYQTAALADLPATIVTSAASLNNNALVKGAGGAQGTASSAITDDATTVGLGTNFSVTEATGTLTQIGGITTVGNGVPIEQARSVVTSVSANQSVTLATAPAAGGYRINYYASQNAVASSGSCSVFFTFGWTDVGGALTDTTASFTMGTAVSSATRGFGLVPIVVASGNVTYTSTISAGCGGTPTYNVNVYLEAF